MRTSYASSVDVEGRLGESPVLGFPAGTSEAWLPNWLLFAFRNGSALLLQPFRRINLPSVATPPPPTVKHGDHADDEEPEVDYPSWTYFIENRRRNG